VNTVCEHDNADSIDARLSVNPNLPTAVNEYLQGTFKGNPAVSHYTAGDLYLFDDFQVRLTSNRFPVL